MKVCARESMCEDALAPAAGDAPHAASVVFKVQDVVNLLFASPRARSMMDMRPDTGQM